MARFLETESRCDTCILEAEIDSIAGYGLVTPEYHHNDVVSAVNDLMRSCFKTAKATFDSGNPWLVFLPGKKKSLLRQVFELENETDSHKEKLVNLVPNYLAELTNDFALRRKQSDAELNEVIANCRERVAEIGDESAWTVHVANQSVEAAEQHAMELANVLDKRNADYEQLSKKYQKLLVAYSKLLEGTQP